MDQQLLKDYSRKLGISSADATKKALELLRLAEVKCGSSFNSSFGGNNSCQILISLELAAVLYDIPVDRIPLAPRVFSQNLAAKLSGLTKRAYTSAFKAIEQQLDQQKSYSVRDLAIQFGCTDMASMANNVLQRYKERNKVGSEDENFSQVLFPAAALFATARFKKAKIDKTKLQNLTGVKKAMFEQLVGQMEEIIKDLDVEKDDLKGTKRSRGYSELLSEAVEDNLGKPKQKKSETCSIKSVDSDYEEWKRKILENARKYKEQQIDGVK